MALTLAMLRILVKTRECAQLMPIQLISRNLCSAKPSGIDPELEKELKEMVKCDKVVVFMKGVPEKPLCGFSNAVCKVLEAHKAPFTAFDVLEDESLRDGIKKFSNWPTIPQIFVKGELIGGCDILIGMHKSGELIETLKSAGIASAFNNNKLSEKPQ